jgi:urease accessory protein UreE
MIFIRHSSLVIRHSPISVDVRKIVIRSLTVAVLFLQLMGLEHDQSRAREQAERQMGFFHRSQVSADLAYT